MDIRNRAMAGAAPFAHLLGLGRASAATRRAEQTEQDREDEREGEEDRDKNEGDEAARAETEGEEDRDEEDEKPDAARAETESEDEDAEEEEDEDEEEMRGKGPAAAARRRERARCAAIFGSKAAAGQPHVAAQLAFGTTMSAKRAIQLLKTTAATQAPAGKTPSLDRRMAANRVKPVGGGPAAQTPVAGQPGGAASRALAAYRKATGRA